MKEILTTNRISKQAKCIGYHITGVLKTLTIFSHHLDLSVTTHSIVLIGIDLKFEPAVSRENLFFILVEHHLIYHWFFKRMETSRPRCCGKITETVFFCLFFVPCTPWHTIWMETPVNNWVWVLDQTIILVRGPYVHSTIICCFSNNR